VIYLIESAWALATRSALTPEYFWEGTRYMPGCGCDACKRYRKLWSNIKIPL
jgi:hypothetical protein